MNYLMFVGGVNGGVGKSHYCKLLVEYHIRKGIPYILVDADKDNPNVGRIYAPKDYLVSSNAAPKGKKLDTKDVKLDGNSDLISVSSIYFSESLSNYGAADDLIELVKKQNTIVNLPANCEDSLNYWMKESRIKASMTKWDYKISYWFVARAQKDSIDQLMASVPKHPYLDWILVKNSVPTHLWPEEDSAVLAQFLKDQNIRQVSIDYFGLSPDGKTKYEESNLPLHKLIVEGSPLLGGARDRLQFYLDDMILAIDAVFPKQA
jgi:hypothetical protein